MKFKRLIAAAVIGATVITACASCEPAQKDPEPIEVAGRNVNQVVTDEAGTVKSEDGKTVTYDLTAGYGLVQNVRFLGRTYTEDYQMFSEDKVINGVTCFNWTDSGFEITFKGSEISAEIISNRYDQTPIYLYVAVDGKDLPEESNYIKVAGNELGTYTLASGLEDGEHIITVRRGTQCVTSNDFFDERTLAGVTALKSVTVKGEAPELMGRVYDKDIQLEFIGDSITCGDSIFQSEDINGNTVNVADGYRNYAAYCARALDADYNVMSISGNGFICSLFGTPLLDLPDRYLYTCDVCMNADKHGDQYNWDFSKYQPDVVIVNLGTNDIAGYNKGNFTLDEIKYGCDKAVGGGAVEHHTGVFDFLDMIHEKNPNAKILWVCGAMGVRLSDTINEAVNEWNAARGLDIAYFKQMVDCNTVENGKAYDNSHPSEEYGKIYGAEMADYIKTEILKLDSESAE